MLVGKTIFLPAKMPNLQLKPLIRAQTNYEVEVVLQQAHV